MPNSSLSLFRFYVLIYLRLVMPCSHSTTTHSGSASSDSTFESDCISSPGSDYSSDFFCAQPNDNSRSPNFTSTVNRTDTIFSFAWSESAAIDMNEAPAVIDPTEVSTGKSHSQSNRHRPPTLPAPHFWSTLTHRKTFEEYIKVKGLLEVSK